MMWWKKKSVYLLALSTLLAAFVWFQMAMFLAHTIFGVTIKLNLFNFCLSFFKEYSIYYNLASLVMNIIIIFTLLITVVKISMQFILLYQFKKRISFLKDRELSTFYSEKFQVNKEIYVVRSNQYLAFTMGIRSPSIVLSTALIDLLEEEELTAVIEHETFHQHNHDPFMIFILQVIAQSLWFIPLTKWCYINYKIIREILADEYAIQKMGSEIGLSSALLKLIKHRLSAKVAPIVVQFSGESVNYRLQQLVEPKRSIPVKMKPRTVLISIYVMILFLGMVVMTLA
ncbi:M56 family metallopeptidase [Bacillus taeanensis]|uniref:Peptidase M56 domain-containing protein n=1 Tax=Bacillus taeanensis TaxID=273032 RepID=A0A366XR65_9BACI|nr:M56 family metallopeptidase [Bacillus taeanensis]RBW68387.1 hypothetical protein DS031_17155 [Bacillus taeanensis]